MSKTPNLDKYIRSLGGSGDPLPAILKGLISAATYVRTFILQAWKHGFGPNDETLQSPKINKNYAKLKSKGSPKGSTAKRRASATGRDYIDMLSPYHGDHMQQQMDITETGKSRGNYFVILGFKTESAKLKARGNYARRPQFFELANRIKTQASQIVHRYLTNR